LNKIEEIDKICGACGMVVIANNLKNHFEIHRKNK
jgi:hypothetical protein